MFWILWTAFNLRNAESSYASALASYNEKIAGPTAEDTSKSQNSIDQAQISLDQINISLEKTKTTFFSKLCLAISSCNSLKSRLGVVFKVLIDKAVSK